MKGVLIALLVAFLLILPSVSFATTVQNGGMESVSQKNTLFCADLLVWGCTEGSASVWKPNIWNTFFGTHDLGQSWTDAHSGSWSTAVWYQPPSECGWNVTSGTCGETTEGYDGSLVQHNISLSNSPVTVSFWAKKCPFRPVQCNVWNCDGLQYYGTNETNLGRFMFQMTDVNDNNVIGSFPFDATDSWRKYSVTLAGNTTHLFDVYWQTVALNSVQTAPNCILFDDLTLDYAPTLVSPATDYVSDMTTFSNFPYANLGSCLTNYPAGSCNGVTSFRTSRGFATVPLVNITANWTHALCNNPVYGFSSITYVNLTYDDDTFLDVGTLSTIYIRPCQSVVEVPLIGYENLKMINVSVLYSGAYYMNYALNVTSDLSVRSHYQSPLTGYENIFGQSDLYPVVIYDNNVLPNNTHVFKAFNFKPSETSVNNLIFELYDSNDVLIDTSSGNYVFPKGLSEWSYDWLTSPSGTDTIKVKFTSNAGNVYLSDTETDFNLSSIISLVSCSSGCDLTTWVEKELSGDACISDYFPNDIRCVIPPEPEVPIYGTDFTQPLQFVNQTAAIESGWGWVLPLSTPFFILTMLMLVISGVMAYFTKSAEVAVGSLMLLMMAFTFLGVYPIWIGIIFTIIAGLILAKLMGIIGGR